MANIDEHLEIQTIINLLLAKITLNPFIFIIAGVLQHWIVDNLINERPINMFDVKKKDYMSIMLAVVGVIYAIHTNTSIYAILGLLGAILPDIMEGIRMMFGNIKDMWMKGDNGVFHVDLGMNYMFDSRYDFNKDIKRRLIILGVAMIIGGLL
ncbi:MAG: hypothetical protein ACOCZ5_01935 [bacterium]